MSLILRGYIRLLTFACGLLVGIQVPSFMTQYEQRVDAHYLEVSNNISGFQATADLLFDGSLESLIDYYENSNDRVFEQDSGSIRNIYERYNLILSEQTALNAQWYESAYHIVFAANPELRGEAFDAYTYTVPLDVEALQWGFGVALFITLLFESFGSICFRLFLPKRRSKRRFA
jgi:hypothetical protein